MPTGKRKRPIRGTYCTLRLPDDEGELSIIPRAVYAYLNHHSLKDASGWYEAWMLRQQWPTKHGLSMFSALPERVVLWPTLPKAVGFVEKYRVDKQED